MRHEWRSGEVAEARLPGIGPGRPGPWSREGLARRGVLLAFLALAALVLPSGLRANPAPRSVAAAPATVQTSPPQDSPRQRDSTAAGARSASAPGLGLARAGGPPESPFWLRLLRGLLGLAFLLGAVWLFSTRRDAIDWGLVAKGLLFQLVFALLVLKSSWGRGFFRLVNDVFVALIGYTNEGARFLFGNLVQPGVSLPTGGVLQIGANFAFSVLPTIIFFCSLMTILYYLGVMQKVVKGLAWVMQRSLRTSGAETLSAAGNIFVGQTEAPLLIKPFVSTMTLSELNTVMTGGFATVAGGVMAAYVAMLSGYFPTIAGHLLAASVMAAPAGIVVSKMLLPETDEPVTKGQLSIELEEPHVNVIDAAAGGAADGLQLALTVGAMLLAFLALIALGNGLLGWATGLVGLHGITLQRIFGWIFAPIAWMIGVPWRDAVQVGSLFGIKMVANEFVAFQRLSELLAGHAQLARRSVIIATYALTGFANFSSIAIQIGGIGGIAPGRRHDLSRLGLRAMLGGTIATWMTATFAGVLT